MKKNSKGFTLVELLAAIVILGLLITIGLPMIVNMIGNNRNKMYVNDAQKLISKVEYRMKNSGTVIEKPSPGNCIVISLVFLDDNDFAVGPNRGKYVKDASYVVVKNDVNGNLEYSAAIVEELKGGGYKGIELTKEQTLQRNDAYRLVTGIDKDELRRVDVNLTPTYINTKLGNGYNSDKPGNEYIIDIENTYNTPDLSDSVLQNDTAAPKIVSAQIFDNSGSKFNTKKAKLVVVAEDEDTPTKSLSVYLSLKSYDDALKQTPVGYGNSDKFEKEYRFNNYNFGDEVFVYIIIKDFNGNQDKAVLSYEIHKNQPPVIDKEKSKIETTDATGRNLNKARLVLFVTDELDKTDDLNVCVTEDKDATTCSSYKKYKDMFADNEMNYDFETKICSDSGKTKYLKVFVKDSEGDISTQTFEYKLYTNKAPEIKMLSIIPNTDSEPSEGNKNVRLDVEVEDDLTSIEKLKTTVIENYNNQSSKYQFDNLLGNTNFEFKNNKYDGLDRTISVEIKDECGLSSGVEKFTYKFYKDKAPKIEDLSELVSAEPACANEHLCEEFGHKSVDFSFNVYDDLTDEDKIKVCYSEDKNYCNDLANYKNYKSEEYSYVFKNTGEQRLYVSAIDSYGNKTEEETKPYKVYKNQPPIISELKVTSDGSDYPEDSLNVLIDADVEDDNTSDKKLKYYLYEVKGTERVKIAEGLVCEYKDSCDESDEYGEESDEDTTSEDVDENLDEDVDIDDDGGTSGDEGEPGEEEKPIGIQAKLSGEYDGKERVIEFVVEDEEPLKTSDTKKYVVHGNQAPVIDGFTVDSLNFDSKPFGQCVETEIKTVNISDDDGTVIDTEEQEVCKDDKRKGGYEQVIPMITINDDDISSLGNDSDLSEEEQEKQLKELYDKYKMCLSEDPDYCNEDESRYTKYAADFADSVDPYTFKLKNVTYKAATPPNTENPYAGEERTIYARVMDPSRSISEQTSIKYTLYANQAPTIADIDEKSQIKITSALKDYNSTNVKVEVRANDDLDNEEDLKIKVCSEKVGSNTPKCSAYLDYNDSNEYDHDLGKVPYDGSKYELYVVVKDSMQAETTSKKEEYTVYESEGAKIYYASGKLQKGTKTESTGNGITMGDWNTTQYDKILVSYVTSAKGTGYKVCVSKSQDPNSCSEYVGNQDGSFIDGDNSNVRFVYYVDPKGIDIDNADENQDPYYFFVKLEDGSFAEFELEDNRTVNYFEFYPIANYEDCDDYDNSKKEKEYEPVDSNNVISATTCNNNCYYSSTTINVEDTPAATIFENTYTANYKKKVFFHDAFDSSKKCYQKLDPSTEEICFGDDCVDYTTYEANCSFISCFKKPNNTYYQAIGTAVEEEGEVTTENIIVDGEVQEVEVIDKYFHLYEVSKGEDDEAELTQLPTKISSKLYDAVTKKFKGYESCVRVNDSDEE